MVVVTPGEQVEVLVVSVGGGGLVAGVAAYAKTGQDQGGELDTHFVPKIHFLKSPTLTKYPLSL